MFMTVNFYDFKNAFNNIRPDNFSNEALEVLFDYFEQLEEDIGEQIELDVIAICCEYCEEPIQDFIENYSLEEETEGLEEDELLEFIRDHLHNSSEFIGFTNNDQSVVYRNY